MAKVIVKKAPVLFQPVMVVLETIEELQELVSELGEGKGLLLQRAFEELQQHLNCLEEEE